MSAGTLKPANVLLAFTVLFVLFFTGDAGTTTLVQKDIDDLVYEADHIVLGTVIAKSSEWGVNYSQKRSLLYTTYTLRVEQVIKGLETGTLQFRVVGGESESGMLHVPGAPHFELGERTLLFLRSSIPDAICDVVGFEQGRYTVIKDTIVENGMRLDEFLSIVSSRLHR